MGGNLERIWVYLNKRPKVARQSMHIDEYMRTQSNFRRRRKIWKIINEITLASRNSRTTEAVCYRVENKNSFQVSTK